MQEYITLMCIALTGLTGLFVIHDEMREIPPDQKDFLVMKSGFTSCYPDLSGQENRNIPIRLHLESQTGSSVRFRLTGYDDQDGLFLCWGDQKLVLTGPTMSISFHAEGKYLVKLMSGSFLIDLIEVEIQMKETPSIIS